MPIAKILYAFFTVFAVHFLGPKNHLLEKTAAKTAKTLDTGCPRVLWKRGPHVRVGCPKKEPVASRRARGRIQRNRRGEAVQGSESAVAAPAISDRPNAVACAKVENFAQAK